LIANKDARSTWHSTQATVLALQALLAGANNAHDARERKVVITVNDEPVREVIIPADQAEVLQQVDLTPWLKGGETINRITLREPTATSVNFQAIFRYYREADVAAAPTNEPLAVSVTYDRARLAVDETVQATATIVNQMPAAAPMVILDLPIPGGFKIEQGELDELVGSRQIEKYQITARQATIYIRSLAPAAKLELRYRLRATLPVKVAVPPAEAYEYYNPAKRGASQPAALESIKA
ncbi:MAG TPA: hypothetical protein VL096_06880, partial [Pirellulaceae bacterium]|nr:hypothetical protein [Pirellulaceae bacterium]